LFAGEQKTELPPPFISFPASWRQSHVVDSCWPIWKLRSVDVWI
jgi:hypothetical protein